MRVCHLEYILSGVRGRLVGDGVRIIVGVGCDACYLGVLVYVLCEWRLEMLRPSFPFFLPFFLQRLVTKKTL